MYQAKFFPIPGTLVFISLFWQRWDDELSHTRSLLLHLPFSLEKAPRSGFTRSRTLRFYGSHKLCHVISQKTQWVLEPRRQLLALEGTDGLCGLLDALGECCIQHQACASMCVFSDHLFLKIYFYMYKCFAHLYGKYTACMPSVHRDQKRALYSLALELQTAVNAMWVLRSLGPLQEQSVFLTPEPFILSLLIISF